MRDRRIRRLFRFPVRSRQAILRDLDEEFRFHLDMRVDDLMREGLSRTQAERRAEAEFGDRRAAVTACARAGARTERRRSWFLFIADFRVDLGNAVRLAARHPGFTAVAVLALALGAGATTAAFSLVNALFLKPPVAADPDRLVKLRADTNWISWPNYLEFAAADGISDAVAIRGEGANADTGGLPFRMMGNRVSTNFFDVLGVPPALGRTFSAGDTRSDVIVLSDLAWRRRFAADPGVIGQPVMLGGVPHEVVAVMPPAFRGFGPPMLVRDFWAPVTGEEVRQAAALDARYDVIARLDQGVSRQQAEASLSVVASRIRAEHQALPESFSRVTVAGVGGLEAFGGVARSLMPVFAFLALMSIAAVLILVNACANVAGLMLGRAAAREREIAVRVALGAGRGRLVRQLLTEGAVIGGLGAAGGVLLASWLGLGLDRALSTLAFPVALDTTVDLRVMAFAALVALATTLGCGLLPALRASDLRLVPSLNVAHGGSPRSQRLRQALVGTQVALCTVMLIWSALFARSLTNAASVEPGFDPRGVLVASIEFDDDAWRDDGARRLRLMTMQERLAAHPAIERAGTAWTVPLALAARAEYPVFFEGDPRGSTGRRVFGNSVTPGWFETVRIGIRAGRDFSWRDDASAPRVAIVNETFARRYLEGSAVGRTLLRYGDAEPPALESLAIVGVVSDSKYWTLGEAPTPTVYTPTLQDRARGIELHVRTADAAPAAAAVRDEVRRVSPTASVEIRPMEQAIRASLMPAQAAAVTSGVFGLAALLLAMVGLAGLVSYTVTQRTWEMAVRRALGADALDVLHALVRRHAPPIVGGLAAGTLVAVLSGSVLDGFLIGVSPRDPVMLAAAGLAVVVGAVLASVSPVRRALRGSPASLLREG